jgi:hypothetical protein
MNEIMRTAPGIPFAFEAQPWPYSGPGGWIFASLPQGLSREIKELLGNQEEGWGRLKVRARVGQTSWDTAIWYDTKAQTYLLPLKASVRKAEGLTLVGVYRFEVVV